MNIRNNSQHIKVAAFVALLSTALYAAITFDPTTQPLVSVGPYALKSDDLSTEDNRAYRPWYENGAWQGDIIEYSIGKTEVNGVIVGVYRSTTAEDFVDFTPVTDAEKYAFATYGLASLNGTDQNWTARTTFAAREAAAPYNAAAPYWKQRNIFTWNGTSNEPFEWDNLVTAGMADDLDPATAANTLLATDPWASPVLNYIRGDHWNEKNQPNNGTWRSRYSLLGDIVNSNPLYIGPPAEVYTDTAYNTFKNENASRGAIVAVGANDGMLHVFNAANGEELYAYIPSMLIHKLDKLAVVPPYQHTYYVDGRITSTSAKINDNWESVLVGGLGAGEKGLFALKVSADAINFPSSHTVLFEKTGEDGFGHIYGQPSILKMPDGTWSVFTGNGLGTGNRAQLLVVSLDEPSKVTVIDTSDVDPAGLSEPTLIDANNDQIVDLAFAGDSKGNMWRFKFNANPLLGISVTKVFSGGEDQPITTGPEVGEHPNGGYMVYWGTGNATSLIDAQNTNYPTQAVYGIWDSATGNKIATQTLATAINETFPNTDSGDRTETVRYIIENEFETIKQTNKYFKYICPDGNNDCIPIKGWKVLLPTNERLIGGPPQLRAARLSFVTSNPIGTNTLESGKLNPDLEGENWLMSLDYLTGGDGTDTTRASIALNLNADNELDADDMIDGSTPPVGMLLGEGSVSQPSIARLGPSIDMMYINGLELPLPQVEPGGPFFNGHIDVVVDSPLSGGGSKAPNNIAYMSEGYNVQTNDGLGKAVDGLVHEYSDMHGVTYVDLFELEPRRGLTSLDGTPFPPFNGTCPDNSTPINDASGKLYACVVKHLDAELNRAYDTYTRVVTNDSVSLNNGICPENGTSRYGPFYEPVFVDATLDHCIEWTITPGSEVFLMGGSTPIPADKPFIVTLANADLSTAGILQIGCRTWPVEVYQDMITTQLENGILPANLEDTVHGLGTGSLLFTLADIANGETDPEGTQCPEDSPLPTLRVSFEQRSILDLGLHGTRSQCVLGLHQPEDKVCYADSATLSAAESLIPKIQSGKYNDKTLVTDDNPVCGGIDGDEAWTPPTPEAVYAIDASGAIIIDEFGNPVIDYYRTYLQDPSKDWHITWNPNIQGQEDLIGFRWRNGALTLQLIDAKSFDDQNCTAGANRTTNCPLQHPNTLLRTAASKGSVRKGGTFARAFVAEYKGNKLSGKILARGEDTINGIPVKAPNDSGLLYEAAMFWHYGRLADDIRTSAELGTGNPSSTPCYGGDNYHSRLQIEASGANPGEVNRIIDKEITEDELTAYFDALKAVKDCGTDVNTCNNALVVLGQMLALDPDLALLDSLLPYVDMDDLNLPPDILDGGDANPNRDVTSLDIDVGGKPQFINNLRRSWIDLKN